MPDAPPPPPPVVALVRDLIFASRIRATAKELGVELQLVRDPARLLIQPGRRLLVDLNLPGAIEACPAWTRINQGDVVGFVSHVDAETIARARAVGIAKVMARSRFVELLPELLRGTDSRGAGGQGPHLKDGSAALD